MDWVRDLYKDEIRSGFFVTVDRKKIWNVELGLLELLKTICRKHGIRYFAMNGTLLGAVRHQGMIPWDDDIDVGMLRPDYNKFLRAAKEEIREPYFLQNMYSDRAIQFSKIQDLRTTAIEYPDWPIRQGIFLDIFPFDAAPDGSKEMDSIYRIQRELWMAVRAPEDVTIGLQRGLETQSGADVLSEIIRKPLPERMDIFESFMEMQFGKSSYVGFFTDFMQIPEAKFDLSLLEESEEAPFELTKISIPKGYDRWLSEKYGSDYLEIKRWSTPHEGALFAVDVPYTEYLSQINSLEINGATGPLVQKPVWESPIDLICSSSGIVSVEYPKQGICDVVNMGFAGLMLELSAYCSGRNSGSTLSQMVRPAAEFCQTRGLELMAMHAPFEPHDMKREGLNGGMEELALESVRLCGEQGCGYLILPPLCFDAPEERLWEVNRKYYLRIAEEAKACHVAILLENRAADVNGQLLPGLCSNAREAVRWVDELNKACGEEQFGFSLDVGAASLCRQDLYEFVKTMGDRLKMVALREVDRRGERSFLPFTGGREGRSQTDWRKLIFALREIGFEGKMVLSLDGTAASFSPPLCPSVLGLAIAVGSNIRWHVDMERLLASYDQRVLFGAGNMCRAYMRCYGEKYPPRFACDNDERKWGTEFCGLDVRSPEELRKLPENCAVFICNIYYREIWMQLREMGLKNPVLSFSDEYLPSV